MTASYDVRRGHARVDDPDTERTVAQLFDGGGTCLLHLKGELTPHAARALGRALIGWSAWRRDITPTIDHYDREEQQQ